MCGLIGVAGEAAWQLDREAREGLLKRVAHRGPDGQGQWFSCSSSLPYFMGHTRLAIQDPSSMSGQPFHAENVVLTYNGELWNAHAFTLDNPRTTGDTEVVAQMLSRHGEEALPYFDGMFAMAWFDKDDSMIRLARDAWGKVPLYLAESPIDGSVMWASEYGALEPGWPARAVAPGHVLTIDPRVGQVVDDHLWAHTKPIFDHDLDVDLVRLLLREGVKERLVGDRDIAYMLSGGLDSSLILALACEEEAQVTAYTAVLDPDSADLKAARYVAGYYGVELVEVPVPVPNPELIRQAVATVEIPSKAQVEIALAHLPVMEQISKDGFAVCLSGEAADELFGGYGGMQIRAAKASDEAYSAQKLYMVQKMARGNFPRVNKVGMRYGVECRLPFMQHDLVELAIAAPKSVSPPGKKLLKEAAQGVVPERIIKRQKQTFQGAVGTAAAAGSIISGSAVAHYNAIARSLFGHLPRS